jgi:hypothetical protein
LTVADLDGDGIDDVATACMTSQDVWIVYGRATRGYRSRRSVPVGARTSGVVAADLDGDGRPELAVSLEGEGAVSIHKARDDRRYRRVGKVALEKDPRAIAAGDLDGDGRTDLVVACPLARTLDVLWNEREGEAKR